MGRSSLTSSSSSAATKTPRRKASTRVYSSSGRSTKKVGKVTMTYQAPDPLADPVVVSFPSGVPTSLLTNNNDNDDTSGAGAGAGGIRSSSLLPPPQFMMRRIREKAQRGRTIVGKDDACLYQAESHGKGLYDGRRTKLCIAVYNKTKQTLVVQLAAEKGHVYALQQSVQNYTSRYNDIASMTANNHNHNRNVGTSSATAQARYKALFQDFGSTKKKKVLKSQAANRVSVDSVLGAGDIMTGAFQQQSNMSESNRKALKDGKLGQKSDAVELAYAEARRAFLPEFDMEAKEPYLVYSARDIAGDDTWGRISRVADACWHAAKEASAASLNETTITTTPVTSVLVAALTKRGTWHEVTKTILTQHIPMDAPHAKHQVKTTMLLNHFLTFHLCKQQVMRGDVKYIARDLDLPVEICQRCLELFTTTTTTTTTNNTTTGTGGANVIVRYARSKQNRDKCLIHLLLLFLMAQGGRNMKVGNMKPIVDYCQMELSEASNLLREAGCTVLTKYSSTNTTTTTTMSVSLTVPLVFPPPKVRGAKSK